MSLALWEYFWSQGQQLADAVAETAAVADTVSATAIFRVSIGESAAATDADSAKQTFAVVVSESAGAADHPSAMATFRVSVAELQSVADSESEFAQFVASAAESVHAFDSPLAVVHYVANLLDTAAISDITDATIPGQGTTYNVTILEVEVIADSFDADITYGPRIGGGGGIPFVGGGEKDKKKSGQFANDWQPALQMWKSITSSHLDRAIYDPQRGRLCVAFKDGDRYTYYGVRPSAAGQLPRAPSPGKFFRKNIRGKYPFLKS